jgi:fructoselysine 3-epimerase
MLPAMWTSIYWDLSPEDAARRIAGLGWPAIELSTEHLEVLRTADDPGRLKSFRAVVEDAGLQMSQAHIWIMADIAAMDAARREGDRAVVRRDIEVLSALGIQNGVLHPCWGARHETLDSACYQRDLVYEGAASLATAAEKQGVRLALENGMSIRGPEDEVVWDGSVTGLRELIVEVASPALGICLDTGHAILEGWDNAEAVEVAGDLLIALHIADNDGSGDQHRIPYAYGSKVNWPAVVAALKAVGYAGVFNLEIPGERGRPLEVIDAALRYALEVCRRLFAGEVGPVQPK